MMNENGSETDWGIKRFTYTLDQVKDLAELYRLNPKKSNCIELALDVQGPFGITEYSLDIYLVSDVIRFLEKFDRMKEGSSSEWGSGSAWENHIRTALGLELVDKTS